ncbi:general transcription factor iih subunit 3-like [Plakobranchus ocellatus]|uniref:General transcription factor IIH subunit 3 n=1 Tax=Plakobranchus ocellatus TaxID=259542 RepID=A0AAV3ZYY5_9GAST|nr:general transcription factor iih subunit 3-like [Plakobranchus ocellatus]
MEDSTDKGKSSLLIVILDTNSVWWGRKRTADGQFSLSHCVDCISVLANSHLMLRHKNKLAVIAAHTDHSVFLYPQHKSKQTHTVKFPDDGQYEMFRQVEGQLRAQLKKLIMQDKEKVDEMYDVPEQPSDSLIAGAMAVSLCYAHRLEKECPIGETLSTRLLVIKGSEDCPSQYMNFMNAVFTAQKQNIIIDACILDSDSGLLQQACDITGGMYLKVPQIQGLLQYLMWVFLPDPSTRSKMVLPPRAQVDYRAACFCHRNLIDIGYVCSVCLSIYCTFSPICSTCQNLFFCLYSYQACDITGGMYLKIPQIQGLLQYLMWVFLPDPSTRSKMVLPPRAQVDYRAACFCHRNLIDIGYVCSVCLSIYCTFSPICSTCQTTFKILGPQKLKRKKKT